MKNRNYLSIMLFLFFVAALNSCQNSLNKDYPNPTQSPIQGTWEMKSIYWISEDTTYSIDKSQPGMLMLDSDNYAIMWTPTEEPRTPFLNLSKPTNEEMESGFKSIVFNSGTYDYSDSTITTTAKIAKVPGFEGGKQFYHYILKKDTMELTMFDETYPNGTKPEWYGKFKTKFILTKAR